MAKSVWGLLRKGEEKRALDLLKDAYTQDPGAGNIIRLGIGYLWTSDYQGAWTHFRHAINTYHSPADVFHGMAGVAKWCIDEPDSAVDIWRAGLGAPYTVGASIVRLPLLLFASSTLRPNVFSKKKAEEILQEKLSNPLVENWPGPLAKLVLNLLEERDLEPLWVGNLGNRNRGVMPYRRWLTKFYGAALALDRRDLEFDQFHKLMRTMIDTSGAELSEDRHFALLLQCEEFFIARHEVRLAQRQIPSNS